MPRGAGASRLPWVGLAGLGCGFAAALLALEAGRLGHVHGAENSGGRRSTSASRALWDDATLAQVADGSSEPAQSGAAIADADSTSAILSTGAGDADPQQADFSSTKDGSEVHGPVESGVRGGFGADAFEFRRRGHATANVEYPDGTFFDQYHDGALSLEGEYENGERSGDWTSWRPDGSLMLEGQYEGGRREGRWKAYHPNGQVLGEGDFEGGNREGVWSIYYSNGDLKEHGLYENNLRTGPWHFYDPFGQLEARSGFYRNGRKLM